MVIQNYCSALQKYMNVYAISFTDVARRNQNRDSDRRKEKQRIEKEERSRSPLRKETRDRREVRERPKISPIRGPCKFT